MSQATKRRSNAETKAGQYICPECGQVFDDKKAVDSHLHMMHEEHLRTVHEEYHQGMH